MSPRHLTPEHKAAMRRGRVNGAKQRRQRRPLELAETEAAIAELGARIDAMREAGEPVPRELRAELRELSNRRLALRYPSKGGGR